LQFGWYPAGEHSRTSSWRAHERTPLKPHRRTFQRDCILQAPPGVTYFAYGADGVASVLDQFALLKRELPRSPNQVVSSATNIRSTSKNERFEMGCLLPFEMALFFPSKSHLESNARVLLHRRALADTGYCVKRLARALQGRNPREAPLIDFDAFNGPGRPAPPGTESFRAPKGKITLPIHDGGTDTGVPIPAPWVQGNCRSARRRRSEISV